MVICYLPLLIRFQEMNRYYRTRVQMFPYEPRKGMRDRIEGMGGYLCRKSGSLHLFNHLQCAVHSGFCHCGIKSEYLCKGEVFYFTLTFNAGSQAIIAYIAAGNHPFVQHLPVGTGSRVNDSRSRCLPSVAHRIDEAAESPSRSYLTAQV